MDICLPNQKIGRWGKIFIDGNFKKKSCLVKVKIKIRIDRRSSRTSTLRGFIPSLGLNFVAVLVLFNQTNSVLEHTRDQSPLVFRYTGDCTCMQRHAHTFHSPLSWGTNLYLIIPTQSLARDRLLFERKY
jgi:hypothetical protein